MGAIAIDPQDLYAAPAPRARRSAPVRGHLSLVPTGDRVAQREPAPLRITRRGRLALTTTAALVVALVLASVLGSFGAAQARSGVIVEPGMTLSQIAAEELPGLPLSQAVVDIQRANQLSGTSIAAGQLLIIPGR